jgi:hypothetical protein
MHDRVPSDDDENKTENKTFVDGIDFYFDEGLMVLTRKYLLERGYCCGNGCRHCPFAADDGALP